MPSLNKGVARDAGPEKPRTLKLRHVGASQQGGHVATTSCYYEGATGSAAMTITKLSLAGQRSAIAAYSLSPTLKHVAAPKYKGRKDPV